MSYADYITALNNVVYAPSHFLWDSQILTAVFENLCIHIQISLFTSRLIINQFLLFLQYVVARLPTRFSFLLYHTNHAGLAQNPNKAVPFYIMPNIDPSFIMMELLLFYHNEGLTRK